MEFQLKKPIVFFDIEATGLNVLKDKIVQIALIKYSPGSAEPEELELMIKPGVPISPEAMKVHGITHEMLEDKPSFIEIAKQIYDFIGDADLAGYNSDRYDIPMLMEEFARADIELNIDNRNNVDVQKIFYMMEPRTLKAAVRLYCGKELEGAHDALADVRATVDVLKGQLERYKDVDFEDGDGFITKTPIKNDIEALSSFTKNRRTVDATQRLRYDGNGTIVFNFGKYIGKPVAKLLYEDKQYFNWILEKDFSTQVKQIIKKLVKEYADSLPSS